VSNRSNALTATGMTFLGFMLAVVALAGSHQWFFADLVQTICAWTHTRPAATPLAQPPPPPSLSPAPAAVTGSTTYTTNVLTGTLNGISCSGCEWGWVWVWAR
jgi:hypothetical protein